MQGIQVTVWELTCPYTCSSLCPHHHIRKPCHSHHTTADPPCSTAHCRRTSLSENIWKINTYWVLWKKKENQSMLSVVKKCGKSMHTECCENTWKINPYWLLWKKQTWKINPYWVLLTFRWHSIGDRNRRCWTAGLSSSGRCCGLSADWGGVGPSSWGDSRGLSGGGLTQWSHAAGVHRVQHQLTVGRDVQVAVTPAQLLTLSKYPVAINLVV